MEQELNNVYCCDYKAAIKDGIKLMEENKLLPVIVTDPPFNIKYHYNKCKDNMQEKEYYQMLVDITSLAPSVVIHYPEQLHRLSVEKGYPPMKVCSWVYNANTNKQHRDIAFYDIIPDLNRVRQPYKDPNDKRVKKLIEKGSLGARIYDWWQEPQVKNKSKEKTAHPCQMPLKVMENTVGVLPDRVGIIDPFAGSGTTLLACKNKNIPFIGYEIDESYCDIIKQRICGSSSIG